MPQNVQKLFYQTYILPLIDYGCNTWGATTTANIERISKLQKRAARIILQADYMTSSTYMFEELGWQTIPKRLMYNKAVLTFKALNNLTPSYISNLLKPMSESHQLSLRVIMAFCLYPGPGLLYLIARFHIPHQNYGIHFLRR